MIPTQDAHRGTGAGPQEAVRAAPSQDDPRVIQALEDYLAALEAGPRPDRQAFLARHAAIAPALAQALDGLEFIQTAAPQLHGSAGNDPVRSPDIAAEVCPEGTLGDFRIVREVGRGGMGVVYEAVQISLGRRVALKVLPFAGALDARQLQRFQNEAHAAAQLHHTNIVPVHFVGCERGVHFYAMQYIEGQTLAQVIADLRRAAEPRPLGSGAPLGDPTTAYTPLREGGGKDPTPALAALSTECSVRSAAHCQLVARLGVQAAVALEHAHQLGVVHRDIKPANVLVDGRGNLWITDFGLALCQNQAGLTLSGDLVGTLRYMSPEQALAQRVLVDHRTDVYSLGATLYELLTLEPAFGGNDRRELLRQIAFEEPKPPRRLNRAVPAELETILIKAMEKNPADRYATARELAEDLERFLKDEPIRARRPSLGQRARKWSRRHKPLVVAAALVGFLAALLGAGNWLWFAQKRAETAGAVGEALQHASELQANRRWPEALETAERAEALFRLGGGSAELRQRVQEVVADLRMIKRLEEYRLERSGTKDDHFDTDAIDLHFPEAFRHYGIDVETLDAPEAAARIRARSIQVELAAALDDWVLIRKRSQERKPGNKSNGASWKHLIAVAREADPDPWRNQLRAALERLPFDRKTLEELAASADVAGQQAPTLCLLGRCLEQVGSFDRAVAILRQAQQTYPDDLWINHNLAYCLAQMEPQRLDEAIGFFRAALAIRPQSAGIYWNLGKALHLKGNLVEAVAAHRQAVKLAKDSAWYHFELGNELYENGQLKDAIAEYREAIRLKSNYAAAHSRLGVALASSGQPEQAVAAFREAIRLNPDDADYHHDLAKALSADDKPEEAITEYREAVRLKPDDAQNHNDLALVLYRKNLLDEAVTEFHMALHLKPDYAWAHYNLGVALADDRQLDQAIVEYQQAIHFDPKFAQAHTNLGNLLLRKGQPDKALAEFQEALRAKKDFPEAYKAYIGLGMALVTKGRVKEAMAAWRKSIELRQDNAEAHNNLGTALAGQGRLDEAIAEYQQAVGFDPKNAQIHFYLGTVLRRKGRLGEAITEFQTVIRLNRDHAQAHYFLALCLQAEGRPNEAVAEYRETIHLKPDWAPAHLNLGRALAQQAKFNEAAAAYRQAIRLQPGNAGAHNELAWLLATCADAKFRDPQQAVASAKTAVQLAPEERNFWNTLGAAQYRAGDWKEVITALERSMELSKGGDSSDWFFLAMAHWQLGDKGKARQWYQKAVQWMDQNHPKNDQLRRFRAETEELVGVKEKKN
jgi:tetratricopeptide (TPR) repeat protein/serine/threonine protein kinase